MSVKNNQKLEKWNSVIHTIEDAQDAFNTGFELGQSCAFEWQPIETAPRDGTQFLFLDSSRNVDICWWSNVGKAWISHFSDEYGNTESPIYWMPLPSPPEETEESK